MIATAVVSKHILNLSIQIQLINIKFLMICYSFFQKSKSHKIASLADSIPKGVMSFLLRYWHLNFDAIALKPSNISNYAVILF